MDEIQAAQVVLKAISPFVVGVFVKDSLEQPGWIFATGTAAEFRGTRFILTAAHVLTPPPSDLIFLPPPNGGFTICTSLEGGIYPKSQRWDVSGVIGDQEKDIALILFRAAPAISFFDLGEQLHAAPGAGRSVAICGYPKAKSKAVKIGCLVTDLALLDFQGASVINPASIRDLQPYQLAIDYPRSASISPGGYSGSMMWYDKAGCTTLDELRERLALGLAGIVTDHAPAHEALICTRIEAIVEFLSRTL